LNKDLIIRRVADILKETPSAEDIVKKGRNRDKRFLYLAEHMVNKAIAKDALIVGNEGAGINERILQLTNNYVKIPIKGDAESLNVSIAAGILLYEMMK